MIARLRRSRPDADPRVDIVVHEGEGDGRRQVVVARLGKLTDLQADNAIPRLIESLQRLERRTTTPTVDPGPPLAGDLPEGHPVRRQREWTAGARHAADLLLDLVGKGDPGRRPAIDFLLRQTLAHLATSIDACAVLVDSVESTPGWSGWYQMIADIRERLADSAAVDARRSFQSKRATTALYATLATLLAEAKARARQLLASGAHGSLLAALPAAIADVETSPPSGADPLPLSIVRVDDLDALSAGTPSRVAATIAGRFFGCSATTVLRDSAELRNIPHTAQWTDLAYQVRDRRRS